MNLLIRVWQCDRLVAMRSFDTSARAPDSARTLPKPVGSQITCRGSCCAQRVSRLGPVRRVEFPVRSRTRSATAEGGSSAKAECDWRFCATVSSLARFQVCLYSRVEFPGLPSHSFQPLISRSSSRSKSEMSFHNLSPPAPPSSEHSLLYEHRFPTMSLPEFPFAATLLNINKADIAGCPRCLRLVEAICMKDDTFASLLGACFCICCPLSAMTQHVQYDE